MKQQLQIKLLLIILAMGSAFAIKAQCNYSQLGIDIDGEADNDYSGTSVSLSSDGSTVAIGATSNAGGGTRRGHVRVYKNISGTLTQQGADIDGEANNDASGCSVSLSSDGSIVAIGAYLNAGGNASRGHVRVYKNISGTWTQQGADIDGEANGDYSGGSVSLSSDGSTVAIGATENKGGGLFFIGRGHVRVYKYLSGTWTQQGSDIEGEADYDQSGKSVSLSSDGSTVAIGAPYNAGGGYDRGHVRVYKFISGTWAQQGADIDGEVNSDRSGFSVSLSSDGSTVAIGAYQNAGGGTARGHVRVYKNISGTWTQQGADIDGEANGDNSGYSVSLSFDGSTIAIGALNNAGGGTQRGHVRVYNNISGTWTQQGADIDGEANGDYSGRLVSLSSDGSTVAIGAPYNAGGGTARGHVRVYQLTCSAPEINIKSNNMSIVDGDITPSLVDSTNFGGVKTGTFRKFKIFNVGNDTLKITGNSVTGAHIADFTISGLPNYILAGDSSIFKVTFNTNNVGVRNATININSNDADEALYNFDISAGLLGECLNFDGTNDFVITGATGTTITNKTFSAWVKLNDISQSGGAIISIEVGQDSAFDAIVYNETGQGWGFGSNFYTRTQWSGVKETSTSTWVHIAATYEANNYKLYRNGVLILTTTSYGIKSFPSTCNLLIGKRHTSLLHNDLHLNAQIDEVQVWNYARTCAQIKSTMNHELVGNETGLLAYYKFNHGMAASNNSSVTLLQDYQTNSASLNGTLNNFALTSTSSNWNAPGSAASGTTPDPVTEVNVKGNAVNIIDGDNTPSTTDNTNFGQIVSGSFKQFTIENTGGEALVISGISITGSNASDFRVAGVPTSIAANSSATFKVYFNSSASTIRNAVINIASSDCDETTYDFAIRSQKLVCPVTGTSNPDTLTNINGDSLWVNCLNWHSKFLPSTPTDVTITGNSTIKLRPGDTVKCHSLFIENGSKLIITGGKLEVYGSIITQAAFGAINAAGGTLVFSGSDSNKIIGSIPSLYNVIVNKTSGIVFLDGVGFEVKGHLELTNGIIRNDGGVVEIMNGANTSQGNANSFVAGQVRAYSIPSTFVFPTGKGNKWARLAVENTSGGNWRCEYFNEPNSISSVLAPLDHISGKEYWDLEPDGPYTVDVKLYWEDAAYSGIDLAQPSSKLVVAHLDGSDWEDAGNAAVTFAAQGSVTSAPFSNFSPFTLGSLIPAIPLSNHFIKTTAVRKNKVNQIAFTVNRDLQGKQFTIERSIGNAAFTSIGTIDCNNCGTQNFSYTDNTPFATNLQIHYRIKWELANGQIVYSPIKSVQTETNLDLSIYPNPSNGNFVLVTSNENKISSITITDAIGRKIEFTQNNAASNKIEIALPKTLSEGIYYLTLINEAGVQTVQEILIQK